MSSIKNVAIAGGAGSLGTVIVKELVDSGFTVTVLTRSGNDSFPSAVKVKTVDYDDLNGLTEALKGQDAVVSTITTAGVLSQKNLVEASIAASVKRYLPSEFGCDLSNAKARQLPVYGQKVEIESLLEQKTKNTDMTYTNIYNNAFLDWGIEKGFLIDIKNKKLEKYDGGESYFTATPLPMIAKAVAAVLQHPDKTKNADIRVHGARLTQNKLLELAQNVVGKDGWQVAESTIKDKEEQAFANLKNKPGEVMAWIFPMLMCAIYGEGYGGDFSANNDNESLGLKELSESEVEALIRERA